MDARVVRGLSCPGYMSCMPCSLALHKTLSSCTVVEGEQRLRPTESCMHGVCIYRLALGTSDVPGAVACLEEDVVAYVSGRCVAMFRCVHAHVLEAPQQSMWQQQQASQLVGQAIGRSVWCSAAAASSAINMEGLRWELSPPFNPIAGITLFSCMCACSHDPNKIRVSEPCRDVRAITALTVSTDHKWLAVAEDMIGTRPPQVGKEGRKERRRKQGWGQICSRGRSA